MKTVLCLISLSLAPIAAWGEVARSAEDIARDARERPAEVLAFFGVEPGMTVLDLFAGGGYYSELLGRAVGDQGSAIMHNNAAYLQFVGKALADRTARGTLPGNVRRLDAEIASLGIAKASVDMVLMVMTYHDIYFTDENWSIDPDVFFAELRGLLKPGGILAIIDHAAQKGTGSSAAQSLHRIDGAFARRDIEARGFKFDGSLPVLRNPVDDRTTNVFDEAIRGKTDRFVHRYVLQ